MLNKLFLQNFKCYKNQNIYFSNLTVFSGINGSGKSTVIQAILFLRQLALTDQCKDAYGNLVANLNGPLVQFGSVNDLISNWVTNVDNEKIKLIAYNDSGESYSVSLKSLEKRNEDIVPRQMQILEIGEPISCIDSDDFVYLSAERFGPRISFDIPSGNIPLNKLGATGEFTAWRIYNEKNVKNKKLLAKLQEPEQKNFLLQLNNCYSELGKDTRIDVQYLPLVEKMSLSFSFNDGTSWGKNLRPVNVGFGLTYSLPIFTALLGANENNLIIIENPEAHLHPKGQVAIGMFIAKAASAGIQVVVETHSDHVLNGIRLAVKRGIISNSSVMLNFVVNNNNDNGATVLSPKILKNGRIDEWPEGFFDEFENVLSELF